jgi:hypothetical protein
MVGTPVIWMYSSTMHRRSLRACEFALADHDALSRALGNPDAARITFHHPSEVPTR